MWLPYRSHKHSTRNSLSIRNDSESTARSQGGLMRMEIKNRNRLIACVSTRLKIKIASTVGFKLKFNFFKIVVMNY